MPGLATSGVKRHGTVDITQSLDRVLLRRGGITGSQQHIAPLAVSFQISIRQHDGMRGLAQIRHAADSPGGECYIVRRPIKSVTINCECCGRLSEMAVCEGCRFHHIIRLRTLFQRDKQPDRFGIAPRPSGDNDEIAGETKI